MGGLKIGPDKTENDVPPTQDAD